MLKTLQGTLEGLRRLFGPLTSETDFFAPAPTSEVAQPPDYIGCRRFRHSQPGGDDGVRGEGGVERGRGRLTGEGLAGAREEDGGWTGFVVRERRSRGDAAESWGAAEPDDELLARRLQGQLIPEALSSPRSRAICGRSRTVPWPSTTRGSRSAWGGPRPGSPRPESCAA